MFHPSKLVAYTNDKKRCVFGNAPTLSQVSAAYGMDAGAEWLVYQLSDLGEVMGVKETFNGHQISELAQLISAEYHFLKVSELMLFFRYVRMGIYGQFYGTIDTTKMMGWLRVFVRDRNGMYQEREEKEREEKMRNWKRDAMPIEEAIKKYPNVRKFYGKRDNGIFPDGHGEDRQDT